MADVNDNNRNVNNDLAPGTLRRLCTILRCNGCDRSPPETSSNPCPYCGDDAKYIINGNGDRIAYLNEDRYDGFLPDVN